MAKKTYMLLFVVALLLQSANATSTTNTNESNELKQNLLIKRDKLENKEKVNRFAITLYKPNYLLPYYYTASPYNAIYLNQTPNGEKIDKSEVKYQISFKLPLWHSVFSKTTTLFFGYTQLSYWQPYNTNAFFRSTDYEPEVFTQTKLNIPAKYGWILNQIRLGAVHQSNGFGDTLERSWNRIYLQVAASSDKSYLSIRPWVVIHDSSYQKYNPNLANYLGYGEIIYAYKINNAVLTLRAHGLLEHGGQHATLITTFSVPLSKKVSAYLQIFSGYGQSLLEYDHRTNSAGIGFLLNTDV